jgi:hypothetical protein
MCKGRERFISDLEEGGKEEEKEGRRKSMREKQRERERERESAIWASFSLVKFAHKVNHHVCGQNYLSK